MTCQYCGQRQATIQWRVQVNGQEQSAKLCQTCYEQLSMQAQSQQMNQQPGGVPGGSSPDGGATAHEEQNERMLDQFGRDVTDQAKRGLIDPVIGRDVEIEQMTEVLNRRNKNNPVLVGEPGVGKTAIAEGLALKISENDVPAKLQGKQIISLDVASLLSGTSYRGQFEEKMKQIVKELEDDQDVILFIDEIHQIVNAGKTEGSTDAGNILKPALAGGQIQVIGATTLDEYRKIEKDAALERRFEPVHVHEPKVEDMIDILKGLAPKYEAYHGVVYPDETLEACARLSHRYIQDRRMPDKAIDLMDVSGARLNLQNGSGNREDLEARLKTIEKEKREAAEKEEYEKAAKLRQEELQIQDQLAEAKDHRQSEETTVSVADIQQIIEQKTGIPVQKLEQAEQEKLQHLSERLSARVIGQDEAVDAVSKAVRRGRAGFRREGRPIASFMFHGQTGVGKTELTRALAEEMFGDREAMLRLDMSEYMEKHTVSKLIGSPPGYIGHDEAGQLTERVRHRPYSIILLDEMEKAHPDVQHMFLQVLEDGRLTDSHGRTVSFNDTIIVMTTNAKPLEGYFKPEFLNRVDRVVEFGTLTQDELVKIAKLMVKEAAEHSREQGIELTFSEEAYRWLAEHGYDEKYGARPLRRTIQEHVEDPLVDLMLENADLESVHVDTEDGSLTVRPAK
ncbi:ATP-dependent Clp protease ATP-binding subunit [Salisediminibacterium halotolerans]|uniref:ATP-dependent Clp protease ATP-binding subunit n=1 Tax=Salisediminibacterium halotolerans TaxID=517425 RepID=UPI000EB2474E|nr:ATP-dependent Clp protease ATP-binding subunit [Salisediminibacterium halotolerans]RLJ71756.1 ATP-dependent Clp protease ATP-binding subunit ClpE [Actinophytocola xinjiangensis]RPE86906.1 ATP-dependent Clp protease ATP-binding subunit ClpE [Salisediminibacterium halotolerans]TWG32969.1 ATP-dependent Clp protease ATP-binding subunit ClpE [Salisediminibacterium halotolerans]GEL08577.1 ATP-dependent Clp protease ATP-binding subunit ClpE [Salisediminibacterium halotolerans]